MSIILDMTRAVFKIAVTMNLENGEKSSDRIRYVRVKPSVLLLCASLILFLHLSKSPLSSLVVPLGHSVLSSRAMASNSSGNANLSLTLHSDISN